MRKGLKIAFVLVVLAIIGIYIVGGGFGEQSMRKEYLSTNTQFAHRGCYGSLAENSLEGFNKALQLGYQAIETDVSFTRDKQLILFHDENAKRLLGVDSLITDITFNTIKHKPLRFYDRQTKNSVLKLDDFLKTAPKNVKVYLDIKTHSFEVADSLINLISRNNYYNQVGIANSNVVFLSYFKHKDANINTILEGFNKNKEWTYTFIPAKYKPDYVASFLKEVDKAHIKWLSKHNMLHRKIVYGVTNQDLLTVQKFSLKHWIIDP